LEFLGEAANGAEAISVAAVMSPDVVLMDLHMPVVDGIEATRVITTSSRIAVLVVSMLDDDASVFAAMQAGARGYVLKGAAPEDLERAIRAVDRGDAVFGAGIAQRILGTLATAPRMDPEVMFPELTDREREILDHVARGEANGTIAHALSLSPRTVANHVSNVLSKLQAVDRAQVIIRARDAGLGS
jgi:DNA-binding NarL/FixJ family response regulator